MAELGKIQAQKKIACPSCRKILPDWSAEEILSGETLKCPSCLQPVQLPAEVYERAKKTRYLGVNLDITG
ncbi:unnamed protein product [Phaeothamnion confervicola]